MFLNSDTIEAIRNGAVGVMPTDTIYGVVASVRFPEALERIYEVKGRPKNKQMIHLISSLKQLKELGIKLNQAQQDSLNGVWPGPVSVILESDDTLPTSHGGTFTIAVRLPNKTELIDALEKTGPVVATSANVSGEPTPQNIEEIKTQLPGLDFYIEGVVGSTPSRLARMHTDGTLEYLERS